MKITFTNPVTVGDLSRQINITALQVKSVSFNLAGPKGAPNILVSVTLTDPATGYDAHFVYEDTTDTPALWSQLSSGAWLKTLLQRLIKDGSLPPGDIAPA